MIWYVRQKQLVLCRFYEITAVIGVVFSFPDEKAENTVVVTVPCLVSLRLKKSPHLCADKDIITYPVFIAPVLDEFQEWFRCQG